MWAAETSYLSSLAGSWGEGVRVADSVLRWWKTISSCLAPSFSGLLGILSISWFVDTWLSFHVFFQHVYPNCPNLNGNQSAPTGPHCCDFTIHCIWKQTKAHLIFKWGHDLGEWVRASLWSQGVHNARLNITYLLFLILILITPALSMPKKLEFDPMYIMKMVWILPNS